MNDPRKAAAEDIKVLRAYAEKVVVNGLELTEDEQDDKVERLWELIALSSSFKLTEKEMVQLIFRDLFKEAPRCGCPTCQERRGYHLQA